METLETDIARCLRGSETRDRILLSADRRKRAYLQQLAMDAGVDAKTAREAIFGARPRYAPELGLATLRLVRPIDPDGIEFEITGRGADAARIRRSYGDRRML